jgi:GMP synthase-like glutamine amidotransferase
VSDPPAWVEHELAAVREAVEVGVPVLGLCFGGQTLALALGGGVEPARQPEIGWLGIESDDDSIPEGPWAQYHYEVLRPPPGVPELARTPAGPAAFRVGPHLGVQFHPEVTAERMSKWIRMPDSLPPGVTPELIDEQGARHAAAAGEQARRLFDSWWDGR